MGYYIKIVTIIVFLLSGINTNAQENQRRYFAGLSIGTQALDYRGTNVAFEFGRYMGHFEVGASFSYYYNPRAFSSIRQQSLIGSWERDKTYDARLFIGYDLMTLAKNCNKHHLRPRVGFGYAHIDTYGVSINNNTTDLYGWQNQGFETMLGLHYGYDVCKHLAIGAFVEYDIFIREQTLIGASLCAKF